MSFSIVAYGETLWDLLPSGPVLGGAPFNLAYRTNTLGNKGVIITRLGRDEKGEQAFRMIGELGMTVEAVQWDDEHPTGTVEITLDENREPDYVIVPHAAYDYIEYTNTISTVTARADCLCFGTLIQREGKSRETLEKLFSDFNGRYRVLDINLRKNCYTEERVISSIRHADILKINETEIEEVARLFSITPGPVPDTAHLLLGVTDLEIIIVTLGERGAFAESKTERGVYCPGYRINLVDPCGSGDAFTAAFIFSLLEGKELSESVRHGNALGALVATQAGATGSIAETEIQEFLRSNPEEIVDVTFERFRI